MKPKHLFLFILLYAILSGCKKENSNEVTAGPFENTTWQVALTDENPDTNPPGGFGINGINQYYPWLNCNLDDRFSFKDNTLSFDNNGTACENDLKLIFESNTQPYAYNEQSKTLTLGSGNNAIDLQVFELSSSRLKIGVPIPSASGIGYVILIFKRQ